MRRIRLLFILYFLFLSMRTGSSAAQGITPLTRPWLREKFEVAETDAKATQEMLWTIERAGILSAEDCPPIVHAYYGALKTLQARDTFNPAQKLEALDAGIKFLNQSVIDAPDDPEILFLRFATLHHLPAIFVDRKMRLRDLDHLCRLLPTAATGTVDRITALKMVNFLLETDRLSASQDAAMRSLQERLQKENSRQ